MASREQIKTSLKGKFVNQKVVMLIIFLLTFSFGSELLSQQESSEQKPWGHSHRGSNYDEGPRSRPWVMDGIGSTHFPITTSNPEVQKWFDQGNTLLHGFWQFEAERAFRWCLKLDPECAMAYWGLARCTQGSSRGRGFLREAVKRKDAVSQRERDYIELWEAKYKVRGEGAKRKKAIKEYVKRFDNLLINYPDDMEARALYWLEVPSVTMKAEERENSTVRYALDRVLQEVLAREPDHVGALHYRVHNWDGEEGHYALQSCLHLSDVAPTSGHLQHMPGHVLSSIGLWNEAAIAMDSATRVEKDYMRKRMVLPEQNWDYLHNLDYLCYIQEQLGMYEAAFVGAEQLLSGPSNQKTAAVTDFANWTMIRVLVKFEKWEEILNLDQRLFNNKGLLDRALLAYARTQALIGLGRLEEAETELKTFESSVAILDSPKMIGQLMEKLFGSKKSKKSKADDESEENFIAKMVKIRKLELRGRLQLAQGEKQQAIETLKKAAEIQADSWMNDPPRDPVFLSTSLGEIYLGLGRNKEAAEAFESTLEKVINDGFALSGLVVAYHELGDVEKASKAMGQLKAVWKNADRPNRWLNQAEATGVQAAPISNELHAERSYQEFVLNKKGHSLWTPPDAPELSATGADGSNVSLEKYRGKNVILIFYLGGQCLHCMEQMQEATKLAGEFKDLNTEIVAISKDDLSTIRSYAEDNLGVTLLSDPEFSNARRFHSYDEFEEIELHSTILVDASGRVHWSSHGGEPFMDFDFLKNEIERVNARISNGQTALNTSD